MVAQPLSILVVADDRRLLRRLSAFLAVFGYEVHQAAGPRQATAAVAARRPDCIVIDAGKSLGETLRWRSRLPDHAGREHIHTLSLVDESSPVALSEALEAGVDDFLARPIVFGEVLARLRAAARTMEFERRLNQQAGVDRVTGLPSRAAVQRRLEAISGSPTTIGCVLLDVDFLAGVNRQYGWTAGDELLAAIGRKLAERSDPADLTASFGEGRFCALFVGKSEEEAVQWAERVQASAASAEFSVGQASLSPTLSGGVATVRADEATAGVLLRRAEEALASAKQSGRDLIVRHGQFAEEARAWKDLVAQGKLFEGTIARDIMTPCPLVLRPEDSLARAAALLTQTAFSALPVVDDQGKLIGLLSDSSLLGDRAADESGTRGRVGELMTPDPPAKDEETSFAELMRLFQEEPTMLLAVVRDGRPTGLVTANNLLALSVPVTTETFRPTTPFSLKSDYLLIPDLTPAESA